nr:MAG TPA: hypothetical protein [Caudoviricetes sp.]
MSPQAQKSVLSGFTLLQENTLRQNHLNVFKRCLNDFKRGYI